MDYPKEADELRLQFAGLLFSMIQPLPAGSDQVLMLFADLPVCLTVYLTGPECLTETVLNSVAVLMAAQTRVSSAAAMATTVRTMVQKAKMGVSTAWKKATVVLKKATTVVMSSAASLVEKKTAVEIHRQPTIS